MRAKLFEVITDKALSVRSTVVKSRLRDLALLSIEREAAGRPTTNFDIVINDFASLKSRSVRF